MAKMDNPYNGKCPLCSDQLYEEAETLRCGNGHYQIERSKFEKIWKDYMVRSAVLEKRRYDKELENDQFVSMRGEQTEQLLKDLQESNLINPQSDNSGDL